MAEPDYINITLNDSAAKYAAQAKQASTLTRELSDTIDALVDRGFHMIGSDPTVWGNFEALHGLPENTGNTVFDVWNGVKIAIANANNKLSELRDRIG